MDTSATFSGLLRTSGKRVGKFRSVYGAGPAVVGNIDVSNQTSYDGSYCERPGRLRERVALRSR